MSGAPKDKDTSFHKEWLGLAQPIEGLVFSVPVLADAQIAPRIRSGVQADFLEHVQEGAFRDVRALFEHFLGYDRPGMLLPRDALPSQLRFYAPEGRQEVRPSFAIARMPQTSVGEGASAAASDDPFAMFDAPAPKAPPPAETASEPAAGATEEASPYLALVWVLTDDIGAQANASDIDLDRAETLTGPWHTTPTAKFERLLRHAGVPVGFVASPTALRLVYAPQGESTAHLTFRLAHLTERAGRPLVAALELIVHASRSYSADAAHTIEGLLRESRRRQADVTKELAGQVFEAVELLLAGFEQAAARDPHATWLRAALEAPDDHLYQGVLSVVLRLVFLLYAEAQGLVPTHERTYAAHFSVLGLFDKLTEDAGAHPEAMHLRFGAYGRLIALFRGVFLGVRHGTFHLPPRSGRLFDPNAYPFLEGGHPSDSAAINLATQRAEVRLPQVDDGTLYHVLRRLIVFEGQRLSYKALDVEQIGAIYESLMGYHVLPLETAALRLGKGGVWVECAELRGASATERKRLLKEVCEMSPAHIEKVEVALKETEEDSALLERLADLTPGRKAHKARHRALPGRLVLQPGEERRRSGSHYTPRWLCEKVTARTLEPILACLGPSPAVEDILQLKVCDPAMGSGAFLVAACRLLASEVVAAWTRSGELAAISEAHGDAHLHARRLVAQRCLYGVDKNAKAVELAKLSLWLVTMAADLPFTFVDHTLRHGDSLVGLDLKQLSAFHWQPKAQMETVTQALDQALKDAQAARQTIAELANRDDPSAVTQKRLALQDANDATHDMRVLADVCVGAFFAADKPAAREKERLRRLDLVQRALGTPQAARQQPGDQLALADDSPVASNKAEDAEKAWAELRALAQDIRTQHAPFHWWLEFPEVFYATRPDPLSNFKVAGATDMEAFIGNPPFMGGRMITFRVGEAYNEWVTLDGTSMNADLSAHFFRRAAALLGEHGALGVIATNTIDQGDTRSAGLQNIAARGWRLYDATTDMAWPGSAAVTVSVVHASHGSPSTHVSNRLNAKEVVALNSRLQPKAERPDPKPLLSNKGCAFQGSIILGMGFTLTPEERDALVLQNPRNAERIFPYLGGKEVNTSPTQAFDRYVINFGTMSEEKAADWPDLLDIVRASVKPERAKQKRKALRERWWRFAETRPALTEAIAGLPRCLVNSRVSKHLTFAFQRNSYVFAESLYAFPLASDTAFAILQSRIHEVWARLLSSSMKTDLRYAASDCFDTFPFPEPDPRTVMPPLEVAGSALYEARAAFMRDTQQGLTPTYNALKDPAHKGPNGQTDPAIRNLRHLHEAMDRAVLAAYGWQDIEVPPFCPSDTTPEAIAAHAKAMQTFEDEVLDRLHTLNHHRHQTGNANN